MIYSPTRPGNAIRQGDIFKSIPMIDASVRDLKRMEGGKVLRTSWLDILNNDDSVEISAVVAAKAVHAIVITQDCDAVRSPDISLCEIRPFRDVEKRTEKMADTPKKWVSIITQHARINQKWYYLPKGEDFGIDERMGVDFRSVIRIGRPDLEDMKKSLRLARLNDVALAHFRERAGEFFRRYAYDEWYPLSKDELKQYKGSSPEPIEAFDWQK